MFVVLVKKAIENADIIAHITELLETLGISYKNVSFYILSFVHRSIVNERPDFTPEHNERLEFLGDAVLELIITDNLYNDFPEKSEGELTDIRSALVRGSNLAKVSRELHFDEYMLLGKGEEVGGGRNNDYLLANCLEAFLGAIYTDVGITHATIFVEKYVYPTLRHIIENNLFKDFKSLIQEYSQAEYDITPRYEVLSDEGPDHNKIFEVGVYLGEILVGVGNGSSKKKAQENAAEKAFLSKNNWNITN